MTFRTLIRRSLRFHWRAHQGVVLGAAVGSAALIGALVVGDSVRESLRERAVERLGPYETALAPADSFFTRRLARQIESYGVPVATALRLPGTASRLDGAARANQVSVLGVDARFWTNYGVSRFEGMPAQSVALSTALAQQLNAQVGEEVLLRIHKPSALSREVPISPQAGASLALRLTVFGVATPGELGNFSLRPGQTPPLNAFVRLDTLERALDRPGEANLTLVAPLPPQIQRPGNPLLALLPRQVAVWWAKLTGALTANRPPRTQPLPAQKQVEVLNGLLAAGWSLADAGLSLVFVDEFRQLELHSSRIFLEPAVGAAAENLRTLTNGHTAAGVQLPGQPIGAFAVQASGPPILGFVVQQGGTNRVTVWSNGRWSGMPVLPPGALVRPVLIPQALNILQSTQPPAMEAASLQVRPLLTYLVNQFRARTNATPYSMVTAAGPPWTPSDMRDDEILLNQWLADDLQLKPGDTVDLTYFLPESAAQLVEATNRFRVRAIVPPEGMHADRHLMPEFPGLAKAESTHDWDAGFPLVHKIRDKDEDYWKKYRGTPKAFVTLAAGQRMWANRFGNLTAIRFPIPTNEVGRAVPSAPHNGQVDGAVGTPRPTNMVEPYRAVLEKNILANLKPEDLGLRFEPVREQALKAANEAQDFGQLFLGFSFFLIAAALILMALLFQFGLEQRVTEVGTFLALGFTPRQVRRLFLGEGVALAALGGVIGVAAGLGYAWVMLRGLTTIWRDAVNTSALSFHASASTLVIGAVASVVVSGFTIWLNLRKLARQPARELLVGENPEGGSEWSGLRPPSPRPSPPGRGGIVIQPGMESTASVGPAAECHSPSPGGEGRGEGEPPFQPLSSSTSRTKRPPGVRRALTSAATVGCVGFVAAILLLAWAVVTGDTSSTGIFFGAGSLLLISGLAFTALLLRRWASAESQRRFTIRSLGFRGATRRRNRSLAVAGLLACGSFLIVAIGAFKLDANQNAWRRASGTGGFALIGESTLPIIRDLNTKEGRDFYGLDETALAGVSFVPMRVRDGDDASCLNLNRAQKPRLLGVRPELLSLRGAFTFAKLADGVRQATPWLSLERGEFYPKHGQPLRDDEIAGIGDANSIQWALHKKIGDTVDYVDERGQAFKVRLVGAVANSILQGSLLIDEEKFKRRFPGESGYRMFLIDAPSNRVAEVSVTLSRAFQDVGLELTPAPRRLAQFNAVQNTYLNTFQVLGGLGLLLGTAGLGVVVLRNVLERRGELALLLAVGFRARGLRRLVLSEHGALLGLGLAIGMIAALAAILPTLLSPAAEVPIRSLALTLAGLLASGMLWTWLATWLALRGQLLAALRNE